MSESQDNEINEINVTNLNSIRLVQNEGLPGTIETSGGQTTNRYKEQDIFEELPIEKDHFIL